MMLKTPVHKLVLIEEKEKRNHENEDHLPFINKKFKIAQKMENSPKTKSIELKIEKE